MKEKNLPNLFAKKTGLENIWDYEDKIDMWITTHELNTLIKYDVKYEFIEGIEWSHKIRGIDLFPWIPAFMKLKNQQDTYSSTKDPWYNAVLREVLKLCMNIISGKLAESLHLSMIKLSSYSQFIEDELNNEKNLSTNVINVYDHLIQYSVKLTPESEIKK